MLRHSMENQETEKRRVVSGSLLDLSNNPSTHAMPLGTSKHSETTQYHDLPVAIYALQTPPLTETPDPTSANPQQPEAATQSGRVDLDPAILECSEKTMDGITLTSETIANLYKEFVRNYHPFLPVVDVSRGPEKIHSLCPTLFWTIMAVASRRYDKDGELMMRLADILKIFLSEITISPINRFDPGSGGPLLNVASAYTVQAFLIYTMWPSITSSLSADSSWNTAGIAMYSAIRVGLHCPGYARDFGRIKADNPIYPKISEQLRTWICCNIVSQTVATVYGFPAFTSFDASVLSACDGSSGIDIPEPIKQLMLIQHLEEEVAKTLNSNPKDPLGLSELSERLSLIQILSQKLDELEMRLGKMDDCRKFVLLGARVHLLTYYYLDNGGYPELQLQKGMIQAYNSALALLDHGEQAYRRDKSFFRYMPGIYAQILWQSSTIICKVFHSPFSQFIDGHAGRRMYVASINLISKASILKHDMMYRAAEIMQQIWRLFGSLARRNASSSRILIRTRMSASVFFDCLWTMREEIGIRSVAPVILDQRIPEETADEDGVHDLDDDDANNNNNNNKEFYSEENTPGGTPTTLAGPRNLVNRQMELSDTEARAEVLKTVVPYDPVPILTYQRTPGVRVRKSSFSIHEDDGDEAMLPQTPDMMRNVIYRSAEGVDSTPIGKLNNGTPNSSTSAHGRPLMSKIKLNGMMVAPVILSPGDGAGSTSGSGDNEGTRRMDNSMAWSSMQQQQQQQQKLQLQLHLQQQQQYQQQLQQQHIQQDPERAIMDGMEFPSWEADLIWRDVDSLMTDFGFREDEAPTISTNTGSITGYGY